jgi:hypothetical protein
MPAGRPTDYTQDLADEICSQLSEGKSMHRVCVSDDMPDKRTVFRWLRTNEEFCHQYEAAKAESADFLAEEIIEISDDGTNDWMERERSDGSTYEMVNSEHIQRSRLRVDARKWIASKLKPKKYGDKTELTGPEGIALFPTSVTVNVVSPEKDA